MEEIYKGHAIPAETAFDVANMAVSLANSSFRYRALTDISERWENYVNPHGFIPAFNLSPEFLDSIEPITLANFSAVFRRTLHWDARLIPIGWNRMTDSEKIEFFGILFRRKLTELCFHLLAERGGYFRCVVALGAKQGIETGRHYVRFLSGLTSSLRAGPIHILFFKNNEKYPLETLTHYDQSHSVYFGPLRNFIGYGSRYDEDEKFSEISASTENVE